MGLNISATSEELQFKPKRLEIYVKSWVLKTKSSNTLSTQTNKLKKKVQMCFKVYQFNFKLIVKESLRTSKVAKNELKHTIAFENRNWVLVLELITSTMSEELWFQLKPHTYKIFIAF